MATRTEALLRPWSPAFPNTDLRIRERARTLLQSARATLVHTFTEEVQPPVVEKVIYQQLAFPLRTKPTDQFTRLLLDWREGRPIPQGTTIGEDRHIIVVLQPATPFISLPLEDYTPLALRQQFQALHAEPYRQLPLPNAA